MGALNKVIEQIAYKQVEDLIVYLEMLDEQLIKTSKTAKNSQISFTSPATSNSDLNKKLLESQAIIRQLQKDYKANQEALEKLSKKVDEHSTARRNNTRANTDNSVSQSILLKNVKEEETLTSTLTTYIQKLSVERIRVSRVVADYNAQIAMGNELTEQQKIELDQATAAFKKYDAAIKAGKESIGNYHEDVGNYAKANWGLRNSVTQLSRELPALGVNAGTFFLAISNNIGPFKDAIDDITEKNKELAESGQEVVSVKKQLLSAIFSWNTLISVATALLTVYGSKMWDWVKSLWEGSEAMQELNQQKKDFNNIQLQATNNTLKETTQLKEWLAIARNTKLAYNDRKTALDLILSQYGNTSYFKNLKEESILNGDITDSLGKLNKAILANEKANLIDEKIIKNKQTINDLNNKNKQNIDDVAESLKNSDKAYSRVIKSEEEYSRLAMKRILNTSDWTIIGDEQKFKDDMVLQQGLINLNKKYEQEVMPLRIASIGLFEQEDKASDKNTKSIKLNTKAREDYLANEYELLHLRLTNVANANKEIMDDEASSFDLRFQASEQYHQNLIDLANMEAKEQLRILDFTTQERLRTIENEYFNIKEQRDNELKEDKISRADYNKVMKDAEENLQYDRSGIIKDAANKQNIIYENQAQRLIEINKELIGQMRRAWDEINFEKAEINISSTELKGIEQLGEILSSIGDDMSIEDIQRKLQKINEISRDTQTDINRREAQLALDRAERSKVRIEAEIRENGVANNLTEEQIQNQLLNNKALMDADAEIIESKKRIAEADNEKTKNNIDNLLKEKEEQRRFNEAVYEGKLELYDSLKGLASQLFENQISSYDREIERSNEYYDSLLENAENGSEQEKLLQDEKERREEELQKRKVAMQRKQAVFNKLLAIADIGIKLQQEIANINAAFIPPANLPLIGLAIASASIRTATTLAIPLPSYKDGRLGGPEETALIAEGMQNGKFIPEVVTDSRGKNPKLYDKPSIVKLKQGDIVHKSVEDFNDWKMALERASIMSSFSNQFNQLRSFDYHLGREFNGISDKIEKGIEKGFKKATNRITVNNNINLPRNPSNFFN